MSKEEYGAGATWPKHTKRAFWNAALSHARDAGWTLKYLDAPHTFGTVHCPTGEHVFLVDQTARGGETFAREAIKRIDRCPHRHGGSTSKVRDRQRECTQWLDRADQLIETATQGLRLVSKALEASAALHRLALQLESALTNLADAQAVQEEALDAAIATEDAAPPVDAIRQLLARIDAALTSANVPLSALAHSHRDLAAPWRTRMSGLHQRFKTLRSELQALQQRSTSADG